MTLVRWTAAWLAPYRGRVGLILLLSVVEIGLTALAPWALKLIVDSVLGEAELPAPVLAVAPALRGLGDVMLLVLCATAGLAMQVGSEVVRLTHTQLEVEMGQRVVHDLRTRLLDHLQALPLGHHLTHRTADAVYRLDADTYCINDLVTRRGVSHRARRPAPDGDVRGAARRGSHARAAGPRRGAVPLPVASGTTRRR